MICGYAARTSTNATNKPPRSKVQFKHNVFLLTTSKVIHCLTMHHARNTYRGVEF